MARPKAFDEEQLLNKAVELFWRQGYHATSIQDVVDALNINRASLYDTYGDKRTLFIKALQRYRADQTQAVVRFLHQRGEPLAIIRQLLEKTAKDTLNDREHKGCFMVNAAMELVNQDPEIAQIAAENQREIERALEWLIQEGQQNGSITTTQAPQSLARFVFSSLNGIRVVGKMNPDPKALEGIVAVVLSALRISP